MPLKHSTETWLVGFLGAAIVLAGVLAAILPSPTVAPILWFVVLAAAVAYPLSLYPLFKERRADYLFRALHFLPLAIVVASLLLQLLASILPVFQPVNRLYAWGWSLPLVTLSLLALGWFCLHVIRQRRQRLTVLAALFVPLLVLAAAGEQFQWPEQIASVIGGSAQSSSPIAVIPPTSSVSSSNLGKSSDANEEKLRANLRRMARRNARIAALQNQPVSVHSAIDGMQIASAFPTKPSVTPPPHLPSSGSGTEAMIFIVIAAYCATLHRRALRRA